MSLDVHFSSSSEEWATPQPFFDRLNRQHCFSLDAAATKENAKCERFYTKEDNALEKHWVGTVWLNSPYGRVLNQWVEKAYRESLHGAATVVMLLPARTDTRYWHQYIFPHAAEILFIAGRLKFGNAENSAPFPSAIVVFDKSKKKQKIGTMKA